jgi:hypothetical protein
VRGPRSDRSGRAGWSSTPIHTSTSACERRATRRDTSIRWPCSRRVRRRHRRRPRRLQRRWPSLPRLRRRLRTPVLPRPPPRQRQSRRLPPARSRPRRPRRHRCKRSMPRGPLRPRSNRIRRVRPCLVFGPRAASRPTSQAGPRRRASARTGGASRWHRTRLASPQTSHRRQSSGQPLFTMASREPRWGASRYGPPRPDAAGSFRASFSS